MGGTAARSEGNLGAHTRRRRPRAVFDAPFALGRAGASRAEYRDLSLIHIFVSLLVDAGEMTTTITYAPVGAAMSEQRF